MSEWVIPVELETGIPLSIAPRNDLPKPGILGEGANWHHPLHPRTRKEARTNSGKALLVSRVQWTNIHDHVSHHHYFDEYMTKEWEFPETIDREFGMTVLLSAGYIPPRAIKTSFLGPEYVELSEETRNKMWESGIIKVSSESMVYEFLKEYTLRQKIENLVTEIDIEEFLFTADVIRRVMLGNQ